MTPPRLKTEIWFQAQLRVCDLNGISMMVLRKGDRESGAVLLKILRPGAPPLIYAQTRKVDGERAWMKAKLPEPAGEAEAEAYIAREMKRDPDVWVIEIEDRNGAYELDAPVV